MAPIDWNEISNCNIEEISDDIADYFYKKIIKYGSIHENDPKKLTKLFMVTKSVLQLKGLQAEVAMEELEQMAKNQGRLSARREKELIAEIQDLQSQIQDLKGEENMNSNLKMEELETENNSLKKDVKSFKSELSKSKKELEKALQLVDKYETENISFNEEYDKLKDQLEQSKEMTKNLEESKSESNKLKEKELVAKIKSKNSDIHQLLSDVKVLETENSEIKHQKCQLHEKLIEAVDEMDKITKDYIKLKEAYDLSESHVQKLLEQNKILEIEIEDLTNQLNCKSKKDDELLENVSRRVEDWKNVLKSKESEISNLQQLVAQLQSQIELSGINYSEISSLKQALVDRDAQLEILKQQLQLATQDLEENSKLLNELKLNKSEVSLSPGSRLASMIETQNELREKSFSLDKLKNKLKVTEMECKVKDQELSDALTRMRLYEIGEYGLSEAVSEIKDCKNQMRLRNKQIEELTQQINEADLQLGELFEENNMLRVKLSMSPRKSFSDLSKPGAVQSFPVSQRLQHKVEALEEENIELKTSLHKLKMYENKRTLPSNDGFSQPKKKSKARDFENDESNIEASLNRDELDSVLETIEKVRVENNDLRVQLMNFERENKSLYLGMKEILGALREQDAKADVVLKCPSLEKLVQAIDVQDLSGRFDPIWILKSEIDQLQGQNEALRSELKFTRKQALMYLSKIQNRDPNINLYENGAISISSDLIKSSKSFTTASNEFEKHEQVVVPIDDDNVTISADGTDSVISNRSDVDMSEGEVVATPTHTSLDVATKPMLYQNILSEWEKFHEEKRLWRDEVEADLQIRETLKTRLEAYENLILTLGQDESETKRNLSDSTLKSTQMTCLISSLTRRLTIASDVENELRKENEEIKKEIFNMETSCLEKIKYYLRYKERAHSKVLAMQKLLDDCVPMSELESANRNFLELNLNYQKLLKQQHESNHQIHLHKEAENGMQKLTFEHQKLGRDYQFLEEKLAVLEFQFQETNTDGFVSEVKILKLKEANERQRADHINLQYDQLKKSFDTLKERNADLETKFAELTKEFLELKDCERTLKENLNESVSKEIHDALNSKTLELEQKVLNNQEEADRYRSALKSARNQIQAIEKIREITEKDLELSRNLLLDMQSSNDEKLSIGKLHRQIINLQLNETKLQQDLVSYKQKLENSEKRVTSVQQKCVAREDELFNIHSQARHKILFLTRILFELRRQFSSSIPISKQEDLIAEAENLRSENGKLKNQLVKVFEEKNVLEDEKLKLDVKMQSANECIESLTSGSAAVQKIMEWNKRIEIVQLREVHTKRTGERLSSQVDCLKEENNKLEKKLLYLEKKNLKLESLLREKDLEIDNRDLKFLENLQTARASNGEMEFHLDQELNSIDSSPSDQEPQIDNNIEEDSVLSEPLEVSESTDREVKVLREAVLNLEGRLKESEATLKSREEALNDIIARMPTSLPVPLSLNESEVHLVDYFESKQNLTVAHTTIDCLQARLNQKDQSILRYQELLNKVKDDITMQKFEYEKELLDLQNKLQDSQRDAILSKSRKITENDGKHFLMEELNSSLVSKVTELEESLTVSQSKITSLTKQLHSSQQETDVWKIKANNLTKEIVKEQERSLILELIS